MTNDPADKDFDLDPYGDAALLRASQGLVNSQVSAWGFEHAERLHDIATYEQPTPVPAEVARAIEGTVETLSERRRSHQAVAERYLRHPNPDLQAIGAKMLGCRLHGQIFSETDADGRILRQGRRRVMWIDKCNRGPQCAFEANARAQKFIDQVVPTAELLKGACNASVQFWVLSPPNVPLRDLAAMKREYWRQVAALFKKLRARGEVLGAFVALEDPLAKDLEHFNVHFNCLVVVRGPYIPWAPIRQALPWQNKFIPERLMVRTTAARLERAGERVTFAKALQTLMREVIKYSAKITGSPGKRRAAAELPEGTPQAEAPGLVDYRDDALEIWTYAQMRTRRVRTYGWLNGQTKFKAADYERWPRLRRFRDWIEDASPAVQGARVKAFREQRGLSRRQLAEALAHHVDDGAFRCLVRLTELEPADGRRQRPPDKPRRPLSPAEARGLGKVLRCRPEALTRLQGVSAPEIARRLKAEPEAEGWANSGQIRWHRGEQWYRPLYLIQASKSESGEGASFDGSGKRGPPAGPRGARRPGDPDPAAAPQAQNPRNW